jgi:ABC-2 type transport system permease protein
MGESLLLFSSFDNFFLMLIYFLLGFVFYTSIFVGVGSIAGTEQEAQQLTSYLSILIMTPIAILIPILQNPDLTIVKILSYVPFTIPTVMMLKISSGTTNMLEIILTILLLIASTGITIYISAKIFKVGILSYGKRPSLKELIQWIKTA